MSALRAVLAIAALLAAASLASWWAGRLTPPKTPRRPQAAVPAELDTREVKILNFYAARVPERGRPFPLCYGVVNAVKVEMEPPLAELFPSISRCVEVTIRADTRATLTAHGKDGRAVSLEIDLAARVPLPEILFADISAREIRRGDRFTLCYGVRDAERVRVEPEGPDLPVSPKNCATWFPLAAPRRLIAESPAGKAAIELPVRMAGGK